MWTIEVTAQFERWWNGLTEDERVSIDGMIRVLERHGPAMGPPYVVNSVGSRYPQLRQLRVPHQQRHICVIYVSNDPDTTIILLTGAEASPHPAGPCSPEEVALAESVYGFYLARHNS